ncbi:MAG: ACP S-malonyltransferase [Oscillospiraceae bacterium]
MGRDLYEIYPAFRAVLDSAPVDFDLKQLCFDGPEDRLNDTRYTQPCMVAFAAGVTALLKDAGIVPDYTAGLSLGEYSALHCRRGAGRHSAISPGGLPGPGHGRRGEGPPLRHGGGAESGPGYPEADL